jgi:cyclic nucleotide-binding protein
MASTTPSASSTSAPRRTLVALRPDTWYSRIALHKVPPTYLLGAFLVSYLTLAISWLETDKAWLAFGLALIPWGIIMLFEIEWSYRHFQWLALFFTLAVVQTIHYSEHCIEVIQYHIFHDSLADSVAIFTKLNVEYVHFLGDSFLTLGTLALLWRFPRNPWLYIAFPFQVAHQMEHNFLWSTYQFFGAPPGAAGVLGKGGLVGEHGVWNAARPDLHWIYNTVYTIPFVLALIFQCKRTYDESLAEAFPEAPKQELLRASRHMATFQYAPGETITAPGDDVERLYIITEGQALVTEPDEAGNEVEVATLHKGQYFGEIALLIPNAKHTKTVRAKTNLRVLAMDEETFRHLTTVSGATGRALEHLAEERMGTGPATAPPS